MLFMIRLRSLCLQELWGLALRQDPHGAAARERLRLPRPVPVTAGRRMDPPRGWIGRTRLSTLWLKTHCWVDAR
jgi:hypothetical protein